MKDASSTPPPAAWIRKPAQIRALAAPARQEILDAFDVAGPLTMAELAALLGRKPDALYFHVRRLLKVGLLIEHDARKTGRHVAAVYDTAWRPMRLAYEPPATAKDLAAIITAAMRLASRDYAAAIKVHIGRTPQAPSADGGRPADLWGARFKGWLTPDELDQLRTHLEAATDILRAGRPRPDASPVTLSFVLAPAAKPAARKPRP